MLTSPNTPTATTWPPFANASRQHNPRYLYTSRPAPRAPPAVTHLGAAKSNTQKLKEGPSKKELVRSSYQKHTRKTPPAAPPSGRRAKPRVTQQEIIDAHLE